MLKRQHEIVHVTRALNRNSYRNKNHHHVDGWRLDLTHRRLSWSSVLRLQDFTPSQVPCHSHLTFRSYHNSSVNRMIVPFNVGHGSSGNRLSQDSSASKSSPRTKIAESDSSGLRSNRIGTSTTTTAITAASVSPLQRRNAEIELERFQKITSRILHSTDNLLQLEESSSSSTLASIFNEVRVALHYWITRWHYFFHPNLAIAPTSILPAINMHDHDHVRGHGSDEYDESKFSDYGVKQAERILDWIIRMDQKYPTFHIVDRTLFMNQNAAFVNLMEACLLPCTMMATPSTDVSSTPQDMTTRVEKERINNPTNLDSTQDELSAASHLMIDNHVDYTKRLYMDGGYMFASKSITKMNPVTWTSALKAACRIMDKMDSLHSDPNNMLEPDTYSCNAKLNIFAKLSVLMANVSSSHKGKSSAQNLLPQDNDFHWKKYLDHRYPKDTDLPSAFQWKNPQEVIHRMENLLEFMENTYHKTDPVRLKPDETSYNAVVTALARINQPQARERAEWYLKRMERTEDEDLAGCFEPSETMPRTTVYADTVTYNAVLHAFSSSSTPRTRGKPGSHSHQAVRILERMIKRFQQTQRENVQPNTISYGAVLHGMANAGNAQETQRILESMIQLAARPGQPTQVEPNAICFNTCITSWAKSGHPKAADFAQSLLDQMEEMSQKSNNENLRPDIISYSGVISAIARSGASNAADRSECLLRRLMELYEAGEQRLRPDLIIFNSVLGAWAKQYKLELEGKRRVEKDGKSALQRAEALFEEMHRSRDARPCTISYNIMLDMYSRKPDAQKSEELIRQMLERIGTYNFQGPDIISYNALLFSWINADDVRLEKRALELLKEMEGYPVINAFSPVRVIALKPDTLSYNIVLGGLAKKSPERAEEYLYFMEQQYAKSNSSVRPNTVSYNTCIDAWSKCGRADKAELLLRKMMEASKANNDAELMPDVISLTSVITAIVNSGEIDAPNRAERLLRETEAIVAHGGITPNRVTFNVLIDAWAKSGHPDRAQAILLRMEELSKTGHSDLEPDFVSFSSVIHAYAKGGQAEQAENILKRIEALANSGHTLVTPTTYTYASVINAWAKSREPDAPQRALNILDRMEAAYLSGKSDALPNEHCYNSVINALAKSNDPQKAQKAFEVRERMEKPSASHIPIIKPNIVTLSTVLNACAHTKGSSNECMEAFRIARHCFKEVLSGKYGKPNNIAFGEFLFTCSNLIQPGSERDRLIESVFKECCKRGLLDKKTYSSVRRAVHPDLLKRLLDHSQQGGNVTFDHLPAEWRSNAADFKVMHR